MHIEYTYLNNKDCATTPTTNLHKLVWQSQTNQHKSITEEYSSDDEL